MTASSRCWYLNFDAELELARPLGYQSSQRVLSQVRAQARHVQAFVCGEPIFDPAKTPTVGAQAAPWCPTPSALRVLRAHGWQVPSAPALDVLQRVNHRRFVVELPSLLDEALVERTFVEGDDELGWVGQGRWRLKRPYGFAGKGQRVLPAEPSDDDWRWLRDSLREGFCRERQLSLISEWSLHGYVDRATCLRGALCRQQTDVWGRVVSLQTSSSDDADAPSAAALARVWDAVAGRLTDAGYWGPFGIDLLTFVGRGERVCHVLSEVNARFALGWSRGMGADREAALTRWFELG